MTEAEKKVRERWPDARCWEHYPDDWQIAVGKAPDARFIVIRASSEAAAWADAAKRLEEQPAPKSGT